MPKTFYNTVEKSDEHVGVSSETLSDDVHARARVERQNVNGTADVAVCRGPGFSVTISLPIAIARVRLHSRSDEEKTSEKRSPRGVCTRRTALRDLYEADRQNPTPQDTGRRQSIRIPRVVRFSYVFSHPFYTTNVGNEMIASTEGG